MFQCFDVFFIGDHVYSYRQINFNENKRERKIAESLLIKHLRLTQNVRDKSVPLKLFI